MPRCLLSFMASLLASVFLGVLFTEPATDYVAGQPKNRACNEDNSAYPKHPIHVLHGNRTN